MEGQADDAGERRVQGVRSQGLRRDRDGVRRGVVDRDGVGARVDRLDDGTRREVRVDDGRADGETRDGGQLDAGRADADGGGRVGALTRRNGREAGRRVQAEGTRVDEGAAGVVVGRELRIEAQRGSAERDDADRARDLGLDDRGVLVDEEVEVAVAAVGGGSTGDGVGRAAGEEAIGNAAVGDEARTQRELGAGGAAAEGDVVFRTDHAPGARSTGPGRNRPGGGVVAEVARAGIGGREVRAGEARSVGLTHAGDTEGIGVGREGRAGVDGPATDDAVDHAGRGVGRAIDAVQEHEARTRETDLSHGVGAAGITVGPALEVDRGAVGVGTDEVTDVDAVGAAGGDDRLRLQDVAARDDVQGVERRDRVDGAGADDGEAAALEGDGSRGRDTGRQRTRGRVEAEVIPVQGAVEEADRRGGGQRAGVDEVQGAATDDRLARVGRGVGQRGGIVAHADEVQLACDRSGEGAAAVGDQVDRGRAGVGDRAAIAGGGVHAADRGEGLRVVAQVDQGELTVELEVARGAAGRRREDGDRVILTRGQVDRAAVDREVAALEVGQGVEVQRTAAGLDEAGGLADAERAVHVEGRAREDVADEGRTRAGGERTHVEGRRTVANEEGRGAAEFLREQATAGAEATEGGRQRGAEGRRARERHRVDDRVGAEGDRGTHARVLALDPAADAVAEGAARGGVQFARGKGAEVVTEEDSLSG